MMEQRRTILIACSSAEDRSALCSLFCRRYDVFEADSAAAALALLTAQAEEILLVILDYPIASDRVSSVLHTMDENALLEFVPVLVAVTPQELCPAMAFLKLGVDDFLPLPIAADIVSMRVENILNSYRYQQRIASESPAQPLPLSKAITRYRLENQALKLRAELDPLTGLFNRSSTERRISEILDQAPDQLHALLMIDIDNFKCINDTSGHLTGDRVLQLFAGRFKEQFRVSDVFGRVGGDEFVLFLCNVPGKKFIADKLIRTVEVLAEKRSDWAKSLGVTVSIGIALSPKDGTVFKTLYENADKALYTAKASGRNRFCFFSESEANALL